MYILTEHEWIILLTNQAVEFIKENNPGKTGRSVWLPVEKATSSVPFVCQASGLPLYFCQYNSVQTPGKVTGLFPT
jgi:hypothetical protein